MRDALLGFLPAVRCTVDVEDVAEEGGSVHVSVAGVETTEDEGVEFEVAKDLDTSDTERKNERESARRDVVEEVVEDVDG